VAWGLMEFCKCGSSDADSMRIEGLILAGGFVKHPWRRGPGLLRRLGESTPRRPYQLALNLYTRLGRWRNRRRPDVIASFDEFAARRTDLDRRVMWQRLDLLAEFDPRPIAQSTHVPVYYLAGLIDPLIPWILVRRWLAKYCPGYQTGKTCWVADHAILASAPACAARQIMEWITNQSPRRNPKSIVTTS